MYAKLVNKRYKPSTIKKDENLTIKQKLTKFLVVRINKEKQYFLNQQYVKKDKRYPVWLIKYLSNKCMIIAKEINLKISKSFC